MRAMILAAGRGERLRPLTDTVPKPLLMAGGKRLIEHHLDNLTRAGIHKVVINIAWLGDQIRETLGSGEKYGLDITYSDEGEQAMETAGGIIRALPMLGNAPFLVINGDIWCDFDLRQLVEKNIPGEAHLILVENPDHNCEGDFAFENGQLVNSGDTMYTYSGIGIYTPQFFDGMKPGVQPLAPILREKIEQQLVTGEIHHGRWTDVGTVERLQSLSNSL